MTLYIEAIPNPNAPEGSTAIGQPQINLAKPEGSKPVRTLTFAGTTMRPQVFQQRVNAAMALLNADPTCVVELVMGG